MLVIRKTKVTLRTLSELVMGPRLAAPREGIVIIEGGQ